MYGRSIIAALTTTFCLAGDCPPEPTDYTQLRDRIITNLKGGFDIPYDAEAKITNFSVVANTLSMTINFEEDPETTFTSRSLIYGDNIIRTRYEIDCLCDDPEKNLYVTVNFNSTYRSGFGRLPDHRDRKREAPIEDIPAPEDPEALQAGINTPILNVQKGSIPTPATPDVQ